MVGFDPGAEVKDENCEKDEPPGGGVGVEIGPLALLFCVTDESNGPPGMSANYCQPQKPYFEHLTYWY